MEQTTTSMREIQFEQLQQENQAWRAKFEAERNEKLQLTGSASRKDRFIHTLQKEVAAQKNIISELQKKISQTKETHINEIRNYVDEIARLRLETHGNDGEISSTSGRNTEAQHAIRGKQTNKDTKQKTGADAEFSKQSNYEASRAKWLQIDVESQFKKSPKKNEKGWCPEDPIATSKLSSAGEYPQKVRSPKEAIVSSSSTKFAGSHPVMSMFAKHAANVARNQDNGRALDTNNDVHKEGRGSIVKSSAILLDAGRIPTLSSVGKPSVSHLALSTVHSVTVEPQDLDTPIQTDFHLGLFSNQSKEVRGLGIVLDSQHPPASNDLTERSPISEAVPTSAGAEAKVTINISYGDQKNWTFLQRAQSFLTKTSKLEILGTNEHVEAFTIGLNKAMVEQAEQANAVKHWESVALRVLTEVDLLRLELNSRPSCIIPTHRSLMDELEANNLRLEMQTTLVADLQKKLDLGNTIGTVTNAGKQTDSCADH